MTSPRQHRDLIAAVGEALQRYQRSVQTFDDAVGRMLGLGPSDLRCLDWLASGPHTAGELARATGLRPSATTSLVDRLERDGWVQRVPVPGDRRRVAVQLTEEGARRLGGVYGPLVAEGPRIFEGWADDDLVRVERLLQEMTDTTDRHRERLGPGARDAD